MSRFTITEEEHAGLDDIVGRFWHKFSALIAASLDENPEAELEDLLLMKLQESASVYGSAYEKHRKDRVSTWKTPQ